MLVAAKKEFWNLPRLRFCSFCSSDLSLQPGLEQELDLPFSSHHLQALTGAEPLNSRAGYWYSFAPLNCGRQERTAPETEKKK